MVLINSNKKLTLGHPAPTFTLKGTDETVHSLSEYSGKPTLIVFICNHCPYVIAKLSELNRIAREFGHKINVIGINSNDTSVYDEDSFENMKRMIETGEIKLTYLFDETQSVAKEYGAVCTPDPFLFDENHNLIFHSRIDDPPGLDNAKTHEMHDAIEQYLNEGKISISESPSQGCSIKWKN